MCLCVFSMGYQKDPDMSCKRQGTHGTGKIRKTGEMAKKYPCQGKHREFENFVKTQGKHREFCQNTGKTQGIRLAQVVNFLILKLKDVVYPFFFPEAG